MSASLGSDSIEIREVWNYNLEKEMKLLQEKIDEFPCVAMDTEFPGTIFQTNWDPNAKSADNYEPLKNNVNTLKLIQLGLTLTDRNGKLPTCGSDKFCIWQFNFREFDKDTDLYSPASLELLTKSGINFPKFKEDGVDSKKFGELLMNSGLVLDSSVEWVTFQGGSDFGYLMKILKGELLPETHSDFLKLMETFSPVYYDVKHLMKYCGGGLHGGLSKVADNLDVKRVGISHQAGSDSLLTSRVFTEIKRRYFNGSIPLDHSKILYGLGADQ